MTEGTGNGNGGAPGGSRTELAAQRTSLARQRTSFAADRTLMAWVRTSLALISFGFTFVKFFQYLGEAAPGRTPWDRQGPRNVGISLVALGTVMVVVAALQNYRVRLSIGGPGQPGARLPGALVVAGAIALIGLLAMIDLLYRTGIF